MEKYFAGNNQTGIKEYEAAPHFVFSNANGFTIVVITKAVNSGLEYEWAIQKFHIE